MVLMTQLNHVSCIFDIFRCKEAIEVLIKYLISLLTDGKILLNRSALMYPKPLLNKEIN